MSRICEICNYCYSFKTENGKAICQRCSVDFDLKNEPIRKCPFDGKEMEKILQENVIIDKCKKCEGIWIDGHEITLLKEQMMKEGYKQGRLQGMVMGMILD